MMEDFEQDTYARFADLQNRIRTRKSAVRTAEAVKTALVLPMIQAFGYDPFDPFEVIPGFTAENSPKIDYAIRDGEEIRIAVLLTSSPCDLQFERTAPFLEAVERIDARCAILTDGSIFRLHARGSESPLDPEPLLDVDFADLRPIDPSGFEHIASGSFDLVALAAGAASRKAREAIVRSIGDEFADPSETFIEAIAQRLAAAGLIRPDDIQELVSKVTLPLVNLVGSRPTPDAALSAPEQTVLDENAMTNDETLAFHIVKAISARHISSDRVVARPAKSYIAILLDDNNRRPIARIHFKSQSVKHLGTFTGDNKETREKISGPSDIYGFEAQIIARIDELEKMDSDA